MSKTDTKKCNNCAAIDYEQDTFCGKCGNRLRYKSREEQKQDIVNVIIKFLNEIKGGGYDCGLFDVTVNLFMSYKKFGLNARYVNKIEELFNIIKEITQGELVFIRIPVTQNTTENGKYFIKYVSGSEIETCLRDKINGNCPDNIDFAHTKVNPNITADMREVKVYFKEDIENDFPFLTYTSNWTEQLDLRNFYTDGIYKLYMSFPVEFIKLVELQYAFNGLKMKTGTDMTGLLGAFVEKKPFVQQ